MVICRSSSSVLVQFNDCQFLLNDPAVIRSPLWDGNQPIISILEHTSISAGWSLRHGSFFILNNKQGGYTSDTIAGLS